MSVAIVKNLKFGDKVIKTDANGNTGDINTGAITANGNVNCNDITAMNITANSGLYVWNGGQQYKIVIDAYGNVKAELQA